MVATILGLLIVVTFIANYIATTLPNTMGTNDLQHELEVENEVSEISAMAVALAEKGAIGAQVTQPLILGSLGAPPFAAPDGGMLTPLPSSANTSGSYPAASINFTLAKSGATVPFSSTGLTGGFVVSMLNTYVPAAQVAYDEGAVVYAQPGSIPIFIDPPQISFSQGVLKWFVPWFLGTLPGESGTGTADLNLRLLSAVSLSIPTDGFTVSSGSQVTFHVLSPYAAAWFAYFQTVKSLASYVSCTGPGSVCTGNYNPNGPLLLGTVTIAIPASAVAQFYLIVAGFVPTLN